MSISSNSQTDGTSSTTAPHGGKRIRAKQSRIQRFVFTLPNYTEDEYNWLVCCENWPRPPKWVIIGKEICPKTNTPHLQGACSLTQQIAFSTLKQWPGFTRAHIEAMKGTVQDSVDYCSKEDKTPFEYGDRPKVGGKASYLVSAITALEAGRTVRELAVEGGHGEAIIRNYQGLTHYRSLRRPHRDPKRPPVVIWINGPTGTGKTRFAYDFARNLYGADGTYICNTSNLQWFDGHDGQPAAIFDDFRAKGVPFHYLLRICDRYPLDVPYKGGFSRWCPELIIFTSPKDVDNTFYERGQHIPEDIRQLKRRITLCIQLPEEEAETINLLGKSLQPTFRVHELLPTDGLEQNTVPAVQLVPVLPNNNLGSPRSSGEWDDEQL